MDRLELLILLVVPILWCSIYCAVVLRDISKRIPKID
jgi:hypothetical protein